MQICVLNGSPKGETSVTMQYVRFLQKANPDHTFVVYHAGNTISRLEKNPEAWDEICMAIQASDLILWATPVYFMHVPSQYKRFIELISEREATRFFSGKYAASLTTSVHFFDQKAHEYLEGISGDLSMAYAGSFSAGMEDLLREENQRQLVLFGDDIIAACRERRPAFRAYPPVPGVSYSYRPGKVLEPVDSRGTHVLVLHDAAPASSLDGMVRQAAQILPGAKVFHLDMIGMNGGCLGCVQCAFANKCVYADNYVTFWKEEVEPAGIIIFAGTIRDRYLSAAWKQFFDRSFFLGHIPRFAGKQVFFLVDGPLGSVPGLRENLSNILSGGHLVDIVTTEPEDPSQIDALIRSVAEKAVRYRVSGYSRPPMFPAIAGRVVLRDVIWSDLRPIFRADHRYFRAHGLYDFPQYQYRKRVHRFFFSLLMAIPSVQKKVRPVLKDYMIRSYARVFQESPVLRDRR